MSQTNFVLIVMYDIAVNDKENQKSYRHLFRYLQRSGFYALQASIYIKPLSEKHKSKRYIEEIKSMELVNAHIRSLVVTHQSFLTMETVMGNDSFAERLIKQPNSVIRV